MPTIVSRSEWGARPRKWLTPISRSQGMFVHHTVTGEGGAETVRAVQNYHMDVKGWSDIAYSWLVTADGTIYEGRGWGVQGGHTEGYNSVSHAVSYVGNGDQNVTEAARASMNWVIAEHNRRYGNGFVQNHNDVDNTGCPGSIISNWVDAGRPSGPVSTPEDGPMNWDKVINEDSHASDIRELQKLLAFWGLYPADEIDGIWGDMTEGGVVKLQKNLNAAGHDAGTADGVWGPKTNAAYKSWILSLNTEPTPEPEPEPSGTSKEELQKAWGEVFAEWGATDQALNSLAAKIASLGKLIDGME